MPAAPEQSSGEVVTVLGLPPRRLTWRPCGNYGGFFPDQAPGMTYATERSDSRPYRVGVGRNQTRRYAVRVTSSSGYAAGATVVVRRSHFRPKRVERIWDYQFDRYINTCINGGLAVRASGGNLYCTIVRSPASARVVFLLR
jgi:hypothetical protein